MPNPSNAQTLRVGDRVSGFGPGIGHEVAESVEVVANSETAINYVTSSVGGVINSRRLLDLPLASRNALDLVQTQAGVNGDGINKQDNLINSGLGAQAVFPASIASKRSG